jgi:hypothetical protein
MKKHVFGGIATALSFFKALAGNETELRIILTDQAQAPLLQSESWQEWKTLDCMQDDVTGKVILPMGDRWSRTFPIRSHDRFIATGWWTAYTLLRLLDWQASAFVKSKQTFVYLIQDFEPGFYPWSSRYLMALSTYQDPSPVIRVFNTQLLQTYFANYLLPNAQEYAFDPQLNSGLAAARDQLIASGGTLQKEKILLLYGRPGTPRNGFELACQGIQHWASQDSNATDWQIISVGEQHAAIPLANGQHIRSLGKLAWKTMPPYSAVQQWGYHSCYRPIQVTLPWKWRLLVYVSSPIPMRIKTYPTLVLLLSLYPSLPQNLLALV